MVEILDLPDELLAHVFRFLPAIESNSVALTCKQFRKAARLEEIWKWCCCRDFKVNDRQLWPGWTYRDFYTKALFRYSFLIGLWHRENAPFGGIVVIKVEQNGFVGYECLPPYNDSYRRAPDALNGLVRLLEETDYSHESLRQLRLRKTFVIKPNFDGVSEVDFVLRTIRSENHECHQPNLGNRIEMTAGNRKLKYDVVFDACLSDFNFFSELEYGFHVADGKLPRLLMVLAMDSRLMFPTGKCSAMPNWFDFRQYQPLQVPRTFSDPEKSPCVKPGFYSGTYGGHGWEIISYRYSEDGRELVGTKLTGDPNIPAGKITNRVFLTKRLVMTAEDQTSFATIQESIDRCDEAWSSEVAQMEYSNDLQPFRIPIGCNHERAPSELPKFCRWFYLAEGQIASAGYSNSQFTPCIFVGFEEDYFAVLWLKLYTLSVYYRANNADTLGS